LNPDPLVETKDNSIGEESRRSQPDYNRPGMLRHSDRYTNSRGQRDLVEHDNPALICSNRCTPIVANILQEYADVFHVKFQQGCHHTEVLSTVTDFVCLIISTFPVDSEGIWR
jgi:hypothetical protein